MRRVTTRGEVVAAAMEVLKREGYSGVNARSVAKAAGCSTQPIYNLFESMDELKKELLAAGNQEYFACVEEERGRGEYPPYKCFGMAYVKLAAKEKQLFQFLFMRERSENESADGQEELAGVVKEVQKATGLSFEEAYAMHLEVWIFVHGLAAQLATGYVEWDMETAANFISDAYSAIKELFLKRKKV